MMSRRRLLRDRKIKIVAENWGLNELIEAATRTGRTDLARDALSRLARKTRAAGTGWALGARPIASSVERRRPCRGPVL